MVITWGIRNFRPYLYGRHFTVITDHLPLTSLRDLSDTTSRLTRLKLRLAGYDLTIIYKKGKLNSNADALSRKPQSNVVTRSQTKTSITTTKPENNTPKFLTLNEDEKLKILKEYHDYP